MGSGVGDWKGVGVSSGDDGGLHTAGIMVAVLMSKSAVNGYLSVKFS